MEFKDDLKKLMVLEGGYTDEDAADLIKRHPKIVIGAIMQAQDETHMHGLLRPTFIAIELAEERQIMTTNPKQIEDE